VNGGGRTDREGRENIEWRIVLQLDEWTEFEERRRF
jgi:hypothetical protein